MVSNPLTLAAIAVPVLESVALAPLIALLISVTMFSTLAFTLPEVNVTFTGVTLSPNVKVNEILLA